MHRDLSLNLALAGGLDQTKPLSMQFPRHPDAEVRRDLISSRRGPVCQASAPVSTKLDGDFLCTRTDGHEPPHVAGVSPVIPAYIAEWDDDRTTDDGSTR